MNKNKQKNISIVVPVFNEEKNLEKALTCLTNQVIDHKFEVIVVDNCSTDNSVRIAKKFNCVVVQEARLGISWARRKGLSVARGDIIVQFDADSLVLSDWLKKITLPFYKDNKTIFTHGVSRSRESNYKSILYFMMINFLKKTLSRTTLMSSGYNIAYDKKVGKEIMSSEKYLKLRHYEDTYFSFAIGKYSGKKVFVQDAVVQTSSRRIVQESLLERFVAWANAMLHYSLFKTFPSWAYEKSFANYR